MLYPSELRGQARSTLSRGDRRRVRMPVRASEHHVARLEVAVDHSRAVRPVESVGDLRSQVHDLGQGQQTLRQLLRQRLALDEFHDEVVRLARPGDIGCAPVVVERADVRVVQRRDGSHLALEAGAHLGMLRELLGQHLDRDFAAQVGVSRAVDLTMSLAPSGARMS
jgi:hypothetical protein